MPSRCVIFTSFVRGKLEYVALPGDIILCADGGYDVALSLGLSPYKVIGDFDSLKGERPPESLTLEYEKEKDDTDTMLCARYAVEMGCEECLIIGGIGGRLDHTIANMQTLVYLLNNGISAVMEDEFERVFPLSDTRHTLNIKQGGIFSLFAYTPMCKGVYALGVKYPLYDATLSFDFPLGVSNVVTQDDASISVSEGVMMVIITKREL